MAGAALFWARLSRFAARRGHGGAGASLRFAGSRAHDDVLKGLSLGRSLGQVAISPDGKRIA